jgi:hypothetical protein
MYKRRFQNIIDMIKDSDKRVVELCFGDTYIAKYCKENNKNWTGIDINKSFVDKAKTNGYNAIYSDIMQSDIPKSDLCIMAGSLYHFIDSLEEVLNRMLQSANRVIISEPIKNLSNMSGILGAIAKRSANAGNGDEEKKFDEDSIISRLNEIKTKLGFEYKIISKDRDILLEIIVERD